jgi:hypothetical protein
LSEIQYIGALGVPNESRGVGVRWGRKIPLLIVWWGFALKADDVDARDGQGANDSGDGCNLVRGLAQHHYF